MRRCDGALGTGLGLWLPRRETARDGEMRERMIRAVRL